MQEVDKLYGPLEWRLPEAHAIYWASVGLGKVSTKDVLLLRRAIYQPLQLAVFRGRVVRLPADGLIETGPDLDKVRLANDGYEKMIAEEQTRKDAIQRAHRNFLREAIYLLYTYHRLGEANYWFNYLRAKYPDGVPPNLTLEEYAFEKLIGNLDTLSYDKTKAIIEGLIFQSYRSLAVGEEDRANGTMGMARQLWQYYRDKTAGFEKRVGLPPFEARKASVVDLILKGESPLAPELIPVLRSRLGLPAPVAASTNTPPKKP